MNYLALVTTFALLLSLQSTAVAVTIKDAVFNAKNAGRVVFSHSRHLQESGMTDNCRACHDAIFDLRNKTSHSMTEMAQGKSCGACHDGKKAFDLGKCAHCHQTKEIIYKVKATGPTRFSHKSHLADSADCSRCHPSTFSTGKNKRYTMSAMSAGKSCGACHNGKQAFSVKECVNCHQTKEIVYKVAATGPTIFSHKAHLAVSADCTQCHPSTFSTGKNKRYTMAAMSTGKSCGACHNGKQAFSVKECVKCHPVRELLFEEKSTGNVSFSHEFHRKAYTCGDCHPSLYRPDRSKIKISMQAMEKGKSCGACHDGKTAFTVKEQCEMCHKI